MRTLKPWLPALLSLNALAAFAQQQEAQPPLPIVIGPLRRDLSATTVGRPRGHSPVRRKRTIENQSSQRGLGCVQGAGLKHDQLCVGQVLASCAPSKKGSRRTGLSSRDQGAEDDYKHSDLMLM